MIVRRVDDHLLLITQPDHAHLAASVMGNCVALDDHPRRAMILHAISEHDVGWAVEDASPCVLPSTGEVADFIRAPASMRRGVWPRAVGLLAEEDPWPAALIAQHALTVYTRLRSDPEWRPFFNEMAALRDALVFRTDLTLADLEADYVFLRLGDLISLTFCTGSDDFNQFGEWKVSRSGDVVMVEPDLFGGTKVLMRVLATQLPVRNFRSDADLRDSIRRAPSATLTGTVRGP